jgi:hypothetical protein
MATACTGRKRTPSWIGSTHQQKGTGPVDDTHAYRAYLLRLWPAQEAGQTVWRASLESARTGEQVGFRTLQRLFAFLDDQTAYGNGGMEPASRTGASNAPRDMDR